MDNWFALLEDVAKGRPEPWRPDVIMTPTRYADWLKMLVEAPPAPKDSDA